MQKSYMKYFSKIKQLTVSSMYVTDLLENFSYETLCYLSLEK